jgi:SPP1 family holin
MDIKKKLKRKLRLFVLNRMEGLIIDRGTMIRTIILAIALINQFLTAFGLTKIPGTSEEQILVISTIFTAVTAIITWFKNNYLTTKGKKQKELLQKNGLTNVK